MANSMSCCPAPPVRRRDIRYVATVKQPRTDDSLKNDHGEIDYSNETNWSQYLSGMYCAIQDVRSFEPMVSDQLSGALTHAVVTRFSSAKAAITPSMKILTSRKGLAMTLYVAGPPKLINEDWLSIPCVQEVPG